MLALIVRNGQFAGPSADELLIVQLHARKNVLKERERRGVLRISEGENKNVVGRQVGEFELEIGNDDVSVLNGFVQQSKQTRVNRLLALQLRLISVVKHT